MSFSFNFVPNAEHASTFVNADSSGACIEVGKKQPEKMNSWFSWIKQETAGSFFESFLQKEHAQNESIPLVPRQQQGVRTANDYILRVREESASFRSRNTDLVPGVYEGGLKVWECSVDMCRYFLSQNIIIDGHVLELGCGHGLPGIFILKQAILLSQQKPIDCCITFSDYNEFVIKDVTMPNVAINVQDTCSKRLDSVDGQQNIEHWLREHVTFGAGDWLVMSDTLFEKGTDSIALKQPKHPALPKDGLYDCILASETTYSETSAMETAELLSRHLKPGKGVSYISTKRYYFGVGGGTKCLCDALHKQKAHKFHIETLKVYDNGAGNIRELLLVKSLGPKS
uniref:protein-histidine N-methyltransferase n=1 Tax=Pseudo-nitzschia australis TaxID=44445 RepID=A0A6U9W0X7_9STRA|mmetsp:Transcript_3807/g.8204  ORF Transcript_3807/g.8204 Transcript_3807/m.8204 type:complete len:342 (+) Transcript_3807:106-1131(+)